VERYNDKVTTAALLEAVEAARALPGGPARATHPVAWQPEVLRMFAKDMASMEAAQVPK
jgi:hypothetical protein